MRERGDMRGGGREGDVVESSKNSSGPELPMGT